MIDANENTVCTPAARRNLEARKAAHKAWLREQIAQIKGQIERRDGSAFEGWLGTAD